MHKEKAPQFLGFNIKQQALVDSFHAYMHHPLNVIDSRHITDNLRRAAKLGSQVMDAVTCVQDDRMQPLKQDFARKIFTRGLYAVADSSRSKVLKSEKDGVCVMTLMMAGRMMITLSGGKEGKPNYSQITFILNDDDPSQFGINSYQGRFSDLQKMIDGAAKRFVDIAQVQKIMQPDVVGFAGVSIGRPQAPKR